MQSETIGLGDRIRDDSPKRAPSLAVRDSGARQCLEIGRELSPKYLTSRGREPGPLGAKHGAMVPDAESDELTERLIRLVLVTAALEGREAAEAILLRARAAGFELRLCLGEGAEKE